MKETGKIKILGVIHNEFSGSKFHRIELPLSKLNGQKINVGGEELTIEISFIKKGIDGFVGKIDELKQKLSENDILYNGWLLGINPGVLGEWLKEYNVKYIQDYDDIFFIPKNHYLHGKSNIKDHISQILLADGLVAATPRIKEWLDNIKIAHNNVVDSIVSDNYLPNEGQFEYVPKVKKDGKIAVGIYGSVSHVNDWALLKGTIKILGNNKKFIEKCKFVVGGYVKGDGNWEKVKSYFNGIKAEVEYIPAKNVYSYMSILDNIDILLAPIEENEFNLTKSNIKLTEAALRDIPVIASKYYLNKGMSICIVKEPEDWQKWIWNLIENDNYLKIGASLGKLNRQLNNFEERVSNLKDYIQKVAEYKYTPDVKLHLYGITYNENQTTEFEKYDNSHIRTLEQKSWRFEYNPILDIVSNKIDNNDEYYGIFSWKFPLKTGISKKIIEKCITSNEYDIIGLSPAYFNNKYLKFSYKQHPGLEEILQKVCNKLNLTLPKEVNNVVYSNFFLAKGSVYKQYVNEIIIPALNYMENEIWEEANKDAQYKWGLTSEKLKEYTEMEYYNFVTFVCERLLSTWLYNNKNITFKQLL